MSTFSDVACDTSIISCLDGNLSEVRRWNKMKALIDEVHKNVCGHANLTDMTLLSELDGLWNKAVYDYVSQLIKKCALSCYYSPQSSRRVSIYSMSRQFNQVVCFDHFYFQSVCLLHCMDISTRFSAAFVCLFCFSRSSRNEI